jgi:hypothetical protein
MIRIRFVTGNDFISNAIRIGERDGWATHTEAFVDGAWVGAHIDGGVEARPPGYDRATLTRELIVDLETSPATAEAFEMFLAEQIGKPYDTTAVIGLGFGRNWREPDSWFCSELIAAALEACGYLPKLSAPDNHISPRDLLLVLSGRVAIPDAA